LIRYFDPEFWTSRKTFKAATLAALNVLTIFKAPLESLPDGESVL
jgi:hypothetical protein